MKSNFCSLLIAGFLTWAGIAQASSLLTNGSFENTGGTFVGGWKSHGFTQLRFRT